MSDNTVERIGDLVVERAEDIFHFCGCPSDFCIQAVGFSVVFGSVNRLIFNPWSGWHVDKQCCTKKFLAKYEEYKRDHQ